MNIRPVLLIVIFHFTGALAIQAGGTIEWEDAKKIIAKTDPVLVEAIERHCSVEAIGTAVRLGPHFGDRAGERVAPFFFAATDLRTKTKFMLTIDVSPDFEFTGRYFVVWEPFPKALKKRDWINPETK